MRRALAPAVLALALAAPAAGATTVSCNLVVDPLRDTTVGPAPAGTIPLDRPAYDIRSADVSSDTRSLTVAVRVRDLPAEAVGAADGARYDLAFTIGSSRRYVVHASRVVGGTTSGVALVEPDALGGWTETPVDAPTHAAFDAARDEVRVTVRVTAFGGLPAGSPVTGLRAATWTERALAASPSWTSTRDLADEATSGATYLAGSPSCLRAAG